jgi:hypothetical protein
MPITPKPVSPSVTGPMPELNINLSICEIGDPCRAGRPAQADTASQPALREGERYICRIHRVKLFFERLGWIDAD